MKWRKILHLFVFFTCFSAGYSQEFATEEDSLHHVLKTSTIKADLASAHSRLGWLNLNRDNSKAKSHLDSAIAIYRDVDDEKGKASTHYRMAVFYRLTGNYAEALSFIDKYLNYVESRSDTINIAHGSFQKGVLFSLQGNYQKSLESYFKAIEVFESANDPGGISVTLNSIGIVYKNLKRYPEAIESYERAMAINKSLNDLDDLAIVYNSLGGIYAILEDHEKALNYYSKSLELNTEIGSAWGIGTGNQNIGTLLAEQGELKKSLIHLTAAYEIHLAEGLKTELAETLASLGMVYRKMGNHETSEAHLKEGLSLQTESKKVRQQLHYELYKLYQEQKEYLLALNQYELFVANKDSVFREENMRNINVLQIQYETEKKDKVLAEQEVQIKDRDFQIVRQRSQNQLAMAGGGLFLLSSVGLLLFYRQRQRLKNKEISNLKQQKEIAVLESLIKGEEKERGRIAQDLHDGINGDLSVIKYKVSSLHSDYWTSKERENYESAIRMLDHACEQVRFISHNLAPASLQNFSLEEAIRQICSRTSNSHNINIDFQYFGGQLTLDQEVETVIYRMIQEMINNIVKHSKATQALIQLNNHGDSLNITVEDNGIGFRVEDHKSGLGLQTIGSRVEFLDAEFNVHSSSEGTTFNVEIDLNKIPRAR